VQAPGEESHELPIGLTIDWRRGDANFQRITVLAGQFGFRSFGLRANPEPHSVIPRLDPCGLGQSLLLSRPRNTTLPGRSTWLRVRACNVLGRISVVKVRQEAHASLIIDCCGQISKVYRHASVQPNVFLCILPHQGVELLG